MNDVELILLGFVLGATPSYEISAVVTAALARRVGVSPSALAKYDEATTGDSGDDSGR